LSELDRVALVERARAHTLPFAEVGVGEDRAAGGRREQHTAIAERLDPGVAVIGRLAPGPSLEVDLL